MTKAIVGFDRWTPLFTFAAAAGSTWDADYPVTNIGTDTLYWPAWAVGATCGFVATSATPWPVGLLAFVGHSAGVDDTFRIEGFYDEALSVAAFDTGVMDFWPVVYRREDLPFEHESFWTGKYSPRQIAKIRYRNRPVRLDKVYQVRGIRVSVTSAGFLCRLFEICQGYELGCNFNFGSTFGPVSRTTAVEAHSGHKEFDVREARQVFKGTIPLMQRSEALTRWQEMQQEHDVHTPFLWFPHPDEEVFWLRTVRFVRNAELGLGEYVSHNRTKVPFSFEGVL
ncbi:hypothetical protein [Azospirillum sp. ST 5-10]|uniref:hypothetical protein n=1 Tax=unclassified Azospirillum TaxID=2630922 RepID=UPI003F4A1652